jgi:hypothetical protein
VTLQSRPPPAPTAESKSGNISMSTLANRVRRIEEADRPKGAQRIIAVRSNGASNELMDEFLTAQGICFDSRTDDVVHICTVFETGDGGVAAEPIMTELLNVTPVKK